MKKLILLIGALSVSASAFAYSSFSHTLTGLEIFLLIVPVGYIVLSIIILVRWFRMTADVRAIRQHITHANPKITYLILIGEKEQAQKAALTMLVDLLYPIYEGYDNNKAEKMDTIIGERLPKIAELGIVLPDYVTSGEKFIDHVNNLTGNTVAY